MQKEPYSIVFLSDFGYNSHYPAICKGVIFSINPHINIIDLTHHISPFNITSANLLLKNSFLYFPSNTIFLCVVDPGVGTKRKGIIIKAFNRFFIGPDNGIFSFIENHYIEKIIFIKNKSYFLSNISNTFHGRDIFAPVAAFISTGTPIENFGIPLKNIKRIKIPTPTFKNNTIYGKIIDIDHFGNLISNIEKEFIEKHFTNNKKLSATIANNPHFIPLRKTYSSVKNGAPVAIINSFNLLEISINRGNAEKYFNATLGTPIALTTR